MYKFLKNLINKKKELKQIKEPQQTKINKKFDWLSFYAGLENTIYTTEQNKSRKLKQNNIKQYKIIDVNNQKYTPAQMYERYTSNSEQTQVLNDYKNYTLDDSVVGYNPYNQAGLSIAPANYFDNLNSLLINNFFIGFAELSLLQQHPIISNVVRIRTDEMLSKWLKFTSKSKQDKTELIKKIEEWVKKHKIQEHFKHCVQTAYAQGGSQLFISYKNDDNQLAEPLLINKLQINKDSVNYFQHVEPIWYTAIDWQAYNPLKPNFYKPQKYVVMGQVVHSTRLLHFKYKPVPDVLKPSYLFNGPSITQELIPYLQGFEQGRINCNKLIAKANHFVLKANLEPLIDDQNPAFQQGQTLGARISAFNYVATNGNIVAINKDTEDFENISTNFGGVTELTEQNMQYVSAISRIPQVKLFENSLKGLNPSGKFENKNFYDTIIEDRVNMVDQHMQTILEICQLDITGEIDHDINFEWLPLGESNELEKSQIEMNKATELATYVNSNILAPIDAAKHLQQSENSGYNNLQIHEEDYDNINIESDVKNEE